MPYASRGILVTIIGLAGALGACGGDASNVNVGTSTATGSVGGIVLQAAPGLPPLAGANVTVVAGGNSFTATTDPNGTFSVKDVPSGSVVVRITAPDRFDVYLTGTLASSAGNFPVSNAALTVGPIAMVSSKGSFNLRVVDESGAAASNIKVIARAGGAWLDLSAGGSTERGVVQSIAMSGPDGIVSLTGLPEYTALGPLTSGSLTVNIPPTKVTGIDSYQFLGLTLTYSPLQLSTGTGQGQTPTIVLAGPHTQLQVLASNLDYLVTRGNGPAGSIIKEAGPITIAFNQAISQSTLRATILDESGGLESINVSPTVNANLVILGFTKPLEGASRYNMLLHVETAYPQQVRELNLTVPFFTPPTTGTAVVPSGTSRIDPNTGDYLLVFNEPIGVGSGSTAQVPCVVFYEADLDGNSQTTSPGEWNSGGNSQLRCATQSGFYLYPMEPAFGPATGFSSYWRIPVRSVCYNNYLCTASGRAVHLQFSRQVDPTWVVKRVDGTPVQDITFTLPQY